MAANTDHQQPGLPSPPRRLLDEIGGFPDTVALLAGLVADAFGILAAIWVVAALTAASGLVVAVRMYETHPA